MMRGRQIDLAHRILRARGHDANTVRCAEGFNTPLWQEALALAAGTQSAETNEDLAQSEGCQSGGDSRNAPDTSHD